MPSVGQVFVPGGLPSFTYVARDQLRLERQVEDYLDERHRVLSLSGPTKSGKTVLLRKVVTEGVWVSGGNVDTVDAFWNLLMDKLDGYPEESKERAKEETDTEGRTGSAGIDLQVVSAGGEKSRSTGTSDTRTHRVGRSRPRELVVGEKLVATGVPVIIDDFHYVPQDVQLGIVRGLKDLVFEGVPVILASVPHRAFDAVRVEREMTGRVEQVPITFWDVSELGMIATRGFDALNLSSDEWHVRTLADESFGSPHLMQDFCKEFCKANDVRETQASGRLLREPHFPSFFQARAANTSKAAFDLLARGPRQRSDRLPRQLKDGRMTDIYGAVLEGIAATGPATALQ